MHKINNILAREIIDSRGNPTIEVDVITSDGSLGRASAPAGASTGQNEAIELRDNDPNRYNKKGVLSAIEKIHTEITPKLIGIDVSSQEKIDNTLLEIDNTQNKSILGGNTTVALSLATSHAAAAAYKIPLYKYWGLDNTPRMPVPMLNLLNGGKHAEGTADFQEFMVVPVGLPTFRKALQAGVEIYHKLKDLLQQQGSQIAVGDEGGFAPQNISTQKALDLLISAIDIAGYKAGIDCFIAIDVAASELLTSTRSYNLKKENVTYSVEEMISFLHTLTQNYPIISIEDGLGELDYRGWGLLNDRCGKKTQIVGDDLYVTNTTLLKKGISENLSNAILIKPNQIGTVSQTLEAIQCAKKVGWGTIISHRSGETEDTSIADLSVGVSAGQIKTGAPARGERTAKYNNLLRIEETLPKDSYFGIDAFKHIEL
ncbi:MAG: phosphopyruvate hydratase [Chloroflexi bacterium]|nr:phosphopyruvate hydratase [Chloroflexota bacterium]MQG05107.1 phosphopyruvate hydratase [SAR202 cluster bacterium]